jgi:hypothetical protein
MERIADKCAVLLACLALVVLAGSVDAVRVVALLVAVGAGACFELVCERWSAAAAAVCCVACALAALVPGAWVALPLTCYDLPRIRSRWALAVAPCCDCVGVGGRCARDHGGGSSRPGCVLDGALVAVRACRWA